MSRTVSLVITAAASAAAVAACTGAGQPAVSPPAPTPSTAGSSSALNSATTTATATPSPAPTRTTAPSSTSIQAAQRQVLDAYLGMQLAFQQAETIPDPGHPDLPRHASGAALRLLVAGLTSMRAEGLRGSGETSFNPKIAELAPPRAPTRARVQDCMDTSRTQLKKINGAPYTDTPGGRRLVVATVQLVGGTWKVTGLGVHDVGSCAG